MANPLKQRRRMTMATADGYDVMADGGVIRRTRNPADRPKGAKAGFNINLACRLSVEALIADRHGHACHEREPAFCYLTVVARALIMARVLRGWRADIRPVVAWAERWTPSLQYNEVEQIARKLCRSPRGLNARRAGKFLNVSQNEIDRLGLQTLQPIDISTKAYKNACHLKKRKADRERINAIRRSQGVRSIKEVSDGSVAEFCRKHGIHRSSYRKAAAKGEAALAAFLRKKGIDQYPVNKEKWPDLSVGNNDTTYRNSATGLATFEKRAGGRLQSSPVLLTDHAAETSATEDKTAACASPLRRLPIQSITQTDGALAIVASQQLAVSSSLAASTDTLARS